MRRGPSKLWPAPAFAALVLSFTPQAAAQVAPEPPPGISPLRIEPDRNGVNITTGKIDIDVPVLSVPAAPRLRFDLLQKAAPYVNGTIAIADPDSPRKDAYTVQTYGGFSESFKCTDGDCKSTARTGSFFLVSVGPPGTGISAIYQRAPTAELYTYDLVNSDASAGTTRTVQSYASRIDYPDGEAITFTYNKHLFNGVTYYRPTRIETNVGYFITISYQSSTFGTNAWSMPLEAALFSSADPVNPLQRLTYSADTTTITDLPGRVWHITGAINQLGNYVESAAGTVQLPSEASSYLTIANRPSYPLIGSITRDGVPWTYSYVSPGLDPVSGDYLYSKLTAAGPNGYSMSYDLVARNHHNVITKSTDALGRATTYTLDIDGRVTDVILPEGNSVHVVYDMKGNISSKTSKAKPATGLADIVETGTYPDPLTCTMPLCWRPTSTTDGLGRVTNYSWNSGGLLTQQLDPANANGVRRETDITYAAPGGIARKTLVRVCGQTTTCSGNADSRTEYTYWNNTFLPLTVTQKDEATGVARTTTYAYDSWGHVLFVQGPQNGASGTTYFRYDQYGRKQWEIGAADGNGIRLAKRFTYRLADDKLTKVETGTVTCASCNTDPLTLTLFEQADTTYDSRRYPIREAVSSGNTNYRVTDRSFLDRGLADCATVRMNLAVLPAPTATSACTLGTAGSFGQDRIARNLYDNAGQLTKIQKALGTSIQQDYVTYAYTPNGKQQFITDANGNKAQYRWDGFDRLQCWIFPSKATPGAVSGDCVTTGDYEKYAYDAAGNRTSLRRRDGRTLTFAFDNLNRMVSKLVPDGCPPIQPPGTGCPPASATRDVYYRYDLLGRQTHAIFDSQSGADRVTNVYDGFGNIAYSVTAIGGLSRQVCSASSPCLYDADNNRTQVRVEGQTVTYAYDARSRLTGVYEGAGTASPLATFAYNADDTLGSRSEGAGGGGSASYGYDAIGRLASQSDAFPAWSASNAGWTFALNPASQIASETRTNDAYAFPVGASSKSYAVNGLNQYTSVAATPYTYDASGNLTGDGTNAHVYDGENRLVSATAAGVTAALTYDPLGRLWRVQKGTADTRFLYDGDALVTEYDATGAVTARYVHGSNAAADDPLVWYLGSGIAAKRYFHPDRLGSIVTATNGASAPTINTYDEYGVPKAANVGRFQYTGQAWLPELGLYYYKARMYSPTLGRFLQVDPIGYGDQLNLYAYAADNPVNLSDSTGLANTCSRVDSTACSGDYEGSLGPGTGGSGLGVYRVTETSTYSSPAGPFSLSTSWLEIRGVSAALQFATPGNPLFRNATFRRAYTGGPDAASTSWWDAYALIDPGYHYLDTNIVLVLSGQYPGDRATVPARQYGLIGGKNDFYQRYTLIGPIYQKPAPLVLNGPRIFFSPTAHALYFAPFHGNPGPGVPTGFIRIRPDAR